MTSSSSLREISPTLEGVPDDAQNTILAFLQNPTDFKPLDNTRLASKTLKKSVETFESTLIKEPITDTITFSGVRQRIRAYQRELLQLLNEDKTAEYTQLKNQLATELANIITTNYNEQKNDNPGITIRDKNDHDDESPLTTLQIILEDLKTCNTALRTAVNDKANRSMAEITEEDADNYMVRLVLPSTAVANCLEIGFPDEYEFYFDYATLNQVIFRSHSEFSNDTLTNLSLNRTQVFAFAVPNAMQTNSAGIKILEQAFFHAAPSFQLEDHESFEGLVFTSLTAKNHKIAALQQQAKMREKEMTELKTTLALRNQEIAELKAKSSKGDSKDSLSLSQNKSSFTQEMKQRSQSSASSSCSVAVMDTSVSVLGKRKKEGDVTATASITDEPPTKYRRT